MASTGKQSPLGINVIGSTLNNEGLHINPIAESYMGVSKTNQTYSFGSLVEDTVLRLLTLGINDGYNRSALGGSQQGGPTLTNTTYDNLISIGANTIPALGNSKPPTYVAEDAAGVWTTQAQAYGLEQTGNTVLPGPANSGYALTGVTDNGQQATWLPYDSTNPNHSVTQWGYIRLHALQAWNEFNWNGSSVTQTRPEYKEFLSSYLNSSSWVETTNQAVIAVHDSEKFLQGIYSNMTDLITADIGGVNLSTGEFGLDLINLGKALDLRTIATFGLPSNLLRTIGKNNAVTTDLSLALLAAGLTKNQISSIIDEPDSIASPQQERQIHGAFLVITCENLKNVLAPLLVDSSVINNLSSLADMLNVSKIFPLSHRSLTVPVYNNVLGLPTNSKTYYQIYVGEPASVNPALSSTTVNDIVGVQIPNGEPINTDATTNFREIPKGFGAYLKNIIPADQAVAAGAFSYAMRQISNIETCEIQRFARTVASLEGVTDLPLVAGTDKPINQSTKDYASNTLAQGSGPHNSYTISDLFGSMSGLPYHWSWIADTLKYLATPELHAVYQQMFLSLTWQGAEVGVEVETRVNPETGLTEYRVESFTVSNSGGGYGRGNAPDPVITASNGGSGLGIVGRDDNKAGPIGTGEYGRITSTTVTNSGDWVTSPPTATIQFPPTTVSGTNTSAGTMGWPSPMNTVVQEYIDRANTEIQSIQTRQAQRTDAFDYGLYMNIEWGQLGTGLKREQRTRYTALDPVPVPKDHFLNTYPASQITFVDSIPSFAPDTRPHMNVQTLEAISDMTTIGGQSIIAMLRQERNQVRLESVGIELDNNLSDTLTPVEVKTVTTNGTLPGINEGIPSSTGLQWTPPAWPSNFDPQDLNAITTPNPNGIYAPPSDSGFEYDTISGFTGFFPVVGPRKAGSIQPIVEGEIPPFVVGARVPTQQPTLPVIDDTIPVVISSPDDTNPDNVLPELDLDFIGSTILPSVPNIAQAIERVIECNCDCWLD